MSKGRKKQKPDRSLLHRLYIHPEYTSFLFDISSFFMSWVYHLLLRQLKSDWSVQHDRLSCSPLRFIRYICIYVLAFTVFSLQYEWSLLFSCLTMTLYQFLSICRKNESVFDQYPGKTASGYCPKQYTFPVLIPPAVFVHYISIHVS